MTLSRRIREKKLPVETSAPLFSVLSEPENVSTGAPPGNDDENVVILAIFRSLSHRIKTLRIRFNATESPCTVHEAIHSPLPSTAAF